MEIAQGQERPPTANIGTYAQRSKVDRFIECFIFQMTLGWGFLVRKILKQLAKLGFSERNAALVL